MRRGRAWKKRARRFHYERAYRASTFEITNLSAQKTRYVRGALWLAYHRTQTQSATQWEFLFNPSTDIDSYYSYDTRTRQKCFIRTGYSFQPSIRLNCSLQERLEGRSSHNGEILRDVSWKLEREQKGYSTAKWKFCLFSLTPCRSKPVKALLVFRTQFKIFWIKTGRLVTPIAYQVNCTVKVQKSITRRLHLPSVQTCQPVRILRSGYAFWPRSTLERFVTLIYAKSWLCLCPHSTQIKLQKKKSSTNQNVFFLQFCHKISLLFISFFIFNTSSLIDL